MSTRFGARNEVAIVGYAQSPIVRHAPKSLGALTADTARQAIADAGLRVEHIDGFVSATMLPTSGDHAAVDGVSIVSANWLAEHLGVNPRYAAGFQGNAQLPSSVMMAVNAVASGTADYVVVHRALHNPAGRYHESRSREARGDQQWTVPQGMGGPFAAIALVYNEYLQRFGATREAMAAVVVEARKNGSRIPWSYWYGRPLTSADYLAEPMISDPIRRYDCDIPIDGVAAFVFTSAARARDLPHRPVYVAGFAAGTPATRRLGLHTPLDDIIDGGAVVARRLFEHAGLARDDIDLPQVYDGFSPYVYFWLEALGYCPVGEAHRFVQDGGIDSDNPSAVPVLAGGGALGNGRMHGVPQMLECYLQLARRAGERQRERATVGIACHSSPQKGAAIAYTSEPF
jgi:acetyl-CoA acetyltransferase